MNVYEQVEKLLNDTPSRPEWADEMLFELREIKRLLEKMQKNHPARNKSKTDYFRFVNKLRKELQADILNDRYPEIHYQGRTLGINLKGFIYDKATTEDLPAHEAFAVYRFLYDNRDKLENYLIR